MTAVVAALRRVSTSVPFRATVAPYLLLDTELRIRAANRAYEQATHHEFADMDSAFMFDVFPNNPATPEARSVERLAASFERALRTGEPDRMELQRYDVVDGPHGFVQKIWLPVNTPIRDDEGVTVGVLHHVEDVTRLLASTALERDLRPPQRARPPRPRGADDAWRSDAAARRAQAQSLISGSRQAIERMSRRIRRGQD